VGEGFGDVGEGEDQGQNGQDKGADGPADGAAEEAGASGEIASIEADGGEERGVGRWSGGPDSLVEEVLAGKGSDQGGGEAQAGDWILRFQQAGGAQRKNEGGGEVDIEFALRLLVELLRFILEVFKSQGGLGSSDAVNPHG
jgi:hypothetical protein